MGSTARGSCGSISSPKKTPTAKGSVFLSCGKKGRQPSDAREGRHRRDKDHRPPQHVVEALT
eukprot:9986036-Prorocentrum_lima.AAC.1